MPQDYEIYDLGVVRLQRGATLRDCKLAYKTFGNLNAAKDNAIVYPTWYSGQHYDNEWLVGSGMALDPDKYFIIIPDMLGNGLSSSPSNTPEPYNGPRFPQVTAYDNVRLQHRLVTEKFGIKKLPLVTGWSMGALQTFHWGALYPDMVERIAPFCGSAKCSRHNFVFLEGVKAALTARTPLSPTAGTRRSQQKACGRWRASMPVGDFRRPSTASGSTSNAWAIPRSKIFWSPSGRASSCRRMPTTFSPCCGLDRMVEIRISCNSSLNQTASLIHDLDLVPRVMFWVTMLARRQGHIALDVRPASAYASPRVALGRPGVHFKRNAGLAVTSYNPTNMAQVHPRPHRSRCGGGRAAAA